MKATSKEVETDVFGSGTSEVLNAVSAVYTVYVHSSEEAYTEFVCL